MVADDGQVERAPAALVFRVVSRRMVEEELAVFHVQHGPAHRRIQCAADRQHGVANRFGLEPAHVDSPAEAVFRVDPRGGGIMGAGHLVRARSQDEPVHGLDRPAAIHEPPGQPIKQRGVQRPLAHPAEVVRCAHQAPAEVPAPEPIDHHPGRQGMANVRQPAGQLKATALLVAENGKVRPGQRARDVSRHRLAQRQMAAAKVDAQVGDIALRHAHRGRQDRCRLLEHG